MGLEREHAQTDEEAAFGGIRTFPLIALSGAAAAYAAETAGAAAMAAIGFAAIATLIAISYFTTSRQGEVGITTEVSALLSFVVGVLCAQDHVSVAAAIGVAAVL